MSGADVLDLSGRGAPRIHVRNSPTCIHAQSHRLRYVTRQHKLSPLPLGVHGFLYYHLPTAEHPSTAQIHFCGTPQSSHMSFSLEYVILKPDGMPWVLPLAVMPKYFPTFSGLLRCDGLVDKEHLRRWGRLPLLGSQSLVNALGEMCTLDMHQVVHHLWVARSNTLHPWKFTLFNDQSGTSGGSTPYTGGSLHFISSLGDKTNGSSQRQD